MCLGELPFFIEALLKDMHRDQHVIIKCSDLNLFFGEGALDVLVRNMILSEPSRSFNISAGKIKSFLDDFSKSEEIDPNNEEHVLRAKSFFTQFLNKESTNYTQVLEAEFLLGPFESKDTYWDYNPKERRDLMARCKEKGNMFYKNGCLELARALYSCGAYLYSSHNFSVLADDVEKTKVRTLKVSLLLNLATTQFKVDNFKDMNDSLREALELEPYNLKILLKRASFNISINELEKAHSDLLTIKEKDPNFPGLRAEIKRLKESGKVAKEKQKSTFSKALQNLQLGVESQGSQNKKLDFTGVDPKEWAKKAAEFYNLNDFDVEDLRKNQILDPLNIE